MRFMFRLLGLPHLGAFFAFTVWGMALANRGGYLGGNRFIFNAPDEIGLASKIRSDDR